ncbi:MAG: nucleotidyltransferase substrate binding protein [Fimbriimonadaceae bacterium]|nr:nucleotidyltransferase substrate binding protein [Fimbriimonadaceae bacterium]
MTALEKFATSVGSLREFVSEPVETKRDVAGVLQGFGTAVELAWKALQQRTTELGFTQRGPRLVLQASLQAGLVPPDVAELWAEMFEDRNLLAHTYRPEMALDLVDRIANQHLPLLEAALKVLQSQGGV